MCVAMGLICLLLASVFILQGDWAWAVFEAIVGVVNIGIALR